MSKNTQSTPNSSETRDNSSLDQYAEFQKLRLENSEIYRKMMTSPLDPFAEFQQLKLETEEINRKNMMGPPLFNSTGNSSNEMLEMVLNELKEFRREMKEIKEDVSMMKTELENQKELFNEMKKSLKEIGENKKKLQEDVRTMKLEQEVQKEALNSINKTLNEEGENSMKIKASVRKVQNDVTGIKKDLVEVQRNQEQHLHKSNVNEIKKEPESYSETDIRRQIYGKWRDVNYHDLYFSAKFEGDTFMEKWYRQNSYNKYTIGVKHPDGWTVTVENNKIVQRYFTDQEEEYRYECYIENERLQRVDYSYGTVEMKYTFERVGDPDPE